MFERFTGRARTVVAGAQDEARNLRQPFIGTEHLLLSLLAHEGLGQELLVARGMTAEATRTRLRAEEDPDGRLDPAALATLGIDLGQVRRAAEQQFGPGALSAGAKPMPQGHLPFNKQAKKVLELAVREAMAAHCQTINSGHLLLGVLAEGDGLGARLILEAGVQAAELTAEARLRAGQQAA
ncbi:MAG: Clp protease N-terminal domain-containing protein [Jatrophihabitans sp.]